MTTRKYYTLFDDMSTDIRWYLDGPTAPGGEWLGTALTRAHRFEGEVPLECRVHHDGPELELTITEEAVPVVNERVAEIFQRLAGPEIQLIPVVVAHSGSKLWCVNVLVAADCVDEERSAEVRRFTAEDGRPERIGEYSQIGGLRIEPVRAGGHIILRIRGWWGTILVAESLARELRLSGVRCELDLAS